ncbi:MAG: P-loop NTPase [Actinomycetota bacterium]
MIDRAQQPSAASGPTGIVDPGRLIVLARRYWTWLLLPPLVLGVMGWLLSARAESRYEASTLVVVRPTAASDLLEGDRSDSLAERELQTEERLLNGPAMDELVEATIGDDIDFEAAAITGTDLLEITAQASSAEGAATAADAVAGLFIEQRRARIQRDLDSAIQVVETEVARIERELAAGTGADGGTSRLSRELDEAQTSLDRLRTESALPSSDARIASAAIAPSDRVAPRPGRAGVLGIMLGLLAGLGLVWLRDVFDRRIRGVEDLPDVATELDFAGPVPRPDTRLLSGPAMQVDLDVADRFRVLANAAVGNRSERSVIQVTGVAGGEGATFVAANLATALAIGGWSTALIDADLDHGDQHHIFRVDATPGTKELLDGARMEAVIQETPVAYGLAVIASGANVVRDATLHRSGLNEILSEVSSRYDVVVIDGPPILGAGDAAVLATHVDKTILVSSANRTTEPQLELAMRTIGASEGALTALVLVEPVATTFGPGSRVNGHARTATPVTRESIETMATVTSDLPIATGSAAVRRYHRRIRRGPRSRVPGRRARSWG